MLEKNSNGRVYWHRDTHSSMSLPTLMGPVPKPWIPGLCVHRHGRICIGGSTRCHDVGAGAAQSPPDRMGGKDHSRLGRIPAGGRRVNNGHNVKPRGQGMRPC